MAVEKKTIAETIYERWAKFKEKHQSGFDKNNGFGGYLWSKCWCTLEDKHTLKFEDSMFVDSPMLEEHKHGEFYDSIRYILDLKLNTNDWSYSVTYGRIPVAQSYDCVDLLEGYDGSGYLSLIHDLDTLELGKKSLQFTKDNMGMPHYMSGFMKFYDILLKLSDKMKRGDREEAFPIEYIVQQIELELNEDAKYHQSECEMYWDQFGGLYGVYDKAYTESVLKSGRTNHCYAECYAGYNPYTGFWRVERNIGKSTATSDEGSDIDKFLTYMKNYVRNSTQFDGFADIIRLYKRDLVAYQKSNNSEE